MRTYETGQNHSHERFERGLAIRAIYNGGQGDHSLINHLLSQSTD